MMFVVIVVLFESIYNTWPLNYSVTALNWLILDISIMNGYFP